MRLILVCCSAVLLRAQDQTASWNLVGRFAADVSVFPESFRTYWKTTLGTGLDLVWFAGRRTGFTVGLNYFPFAIDSERWIEAFEPKLEGFGSLGLRKGSLRALTVSIGIKRIFPTGNGSFLFFFRGAGEYAYLHQQDLSADLIFPDKTYDQHLKVGESQFAYGGCAGIGAEIRLNRRWAIGVDAAAHYMAIRKQKEPSPDFLIRGLIPPDQTGKGFGVLSAQVVYSFGFSKAVQQVSLNHR